MLETEVDEEEEIEENNPVKACSIPKRKTANPFDVSMIASEDLSKVLEKHKVKCYEMREDLVEVILQ